MRKKVVKKIILFIFSFVGKRHHFIHKTLILARINYWKNAGVEIGENTKILGDITIIDPKKIKIGKNSTINQAVIIVGRERITIGNNVRISPGAMIISGGLIVKNIGTRRIHFEKPITIQDNVWIGAGAIILPGITIGKNSVIAAGAVVTKDVGINLIVKGIPGVAYDI